MSKILLNYIVIGKFNKILEDESFSINKYGFKRGRLKDILMNNKKIKYEVAEKICCLYNDYYKNEQLSMKLIFNTSTINGYIGIQNKINFKYGKANKSNYVNRFFFFAFEKISSVINNILGNNKNILSLDKNKIVIFLIILLLIYFTYNLIFGLYGLDLFNGNSSNGSLDIFPNIK